MRRGVKSVGSYAYNQIPRRNGNFNVFTQSRNNSSSFDLATGTNSFQRNQNIFGNQIKAASALGSAASGLFTMLKVHGGRTQRKIKLRKIKTNKSKKRRILEKEIEII